GPGRRRGRRQPRPRRAIPRGATAPVSTTRLGRHSGIGAGVPAAPDRAGRAGAAPPPCYTTHRQAVTGEDTEALAAGASPLSPGAPGAPFPRLPPGAATGAPTRLAVAPNAASEARRQGPRPSVEVRRGEHRDATSGQAT